MMPTIFPATHYQRDWVLACRDERSHFTTPLAWELRGDLDEDVLRATLATLAARHDSLRTSFRRTGADVCQLVWPDVHIALSTEDISEDAVSARILAEAERPRVVSVAPLWHGLLLRLSRHRHVLALFVHHLVFDGWSHGVLHDELIRTHRALAAGRQPRLPQLSVRPGDFARWQREHRDREREEWWRAELRALPEILPPPPVRGRFVSVALPPVTTPAGPGASTRLLAAVCAARGRDDLVVGVTRSGRERPRLHRVLGPLLDHVPVRLRGNAEIAYRESIAHQLPLGRIRELVPDESVAGRLFDTRFNYLPQSAPQPGDAGPVVVTPWSLPPTAIAPRHTEDHPEVLPLSYVLRHHQDGRLTGEICGPDSMFSAEDLAGFAEDFARAATSDRAPARADRFPSAPRGNVTQVGHGCVPEQNLSVPT